MKWIKKFESFVTDDNREDSTQYPGLNPVLRMKATEYVNAKLKSNEYGIIFKAVGMEPPKDIKGVDIDTLFDEVRDKAIEYFVQNPEEIGKDIDTRTYPYNGGDGVVRTNKVGGVMNESNFEFDSSISISAKEMEKFSTDEILQDLIRNEKISLDNKKVSFNKDDKDTIDSLSIYFNMSKFIIKDDTDIDYDEVLNAIKDEGYGDLWNYTSDFEDSKFYKNPKSTKAYTSQFLKYLNNERGF